ncbi:uncharacterized protein LOC127082663 [Lathyrus oleraceus]|uniref:uncharacterized protein LOC127082663 n=1 Tax=Pisum sativum TaxID=3888 RepID=UPI0021D1993A|nr:uncharacterized protein LOC127082663 [Pisum sativum]
MHLRAKHALGVVHFDVCGKFLVPSLVGNKYFVSFVDEFKRITWLYLIKFKHEVFAEFKKFRINSENQCDQKLKILRTDGGDAKRRKLDDRSRVMLLVGCHSTGSYKIYCPVTNKVEFSRYAFMKESEAWDWSTPQSNSGVVLTSKDTSESEGYENESDLEDDSEFKDESESEVDSENSRGDPDSWNITYSEGGHAFEGGTYGVLASDTVQHLKEIMNKFRGRKESETFQGYLQSLICYKTHK